MPEERVAGLSLHYETAGAGDALVLLHGLGSSGRDWALQFPAFAEHYRVIAPDLRGHGQSGKPPGPYSIPLFAADVAGLLDRLHAGPAHVVGLSLGGMVAFQLAVTRPELVRSLVVVNSAPAFRVRTLHEWLLLMERRLLVRVMGLRRFGRVLAARLFPEPGQAHLRQALATRIAANDPRAYRAALGAMTAGWSVEDGLATLRCPTLVIAATGDYTPVADKAAYAARIPGAELQVIQGSRHATPADRPVEFNAAVLGFIARRAAGR